ncbi:aminotransferase class III-fold pyridoxal phosphate-dependent enzyme [Halomonas sp. LS-001]
MTTSYANEAISNQTVKQLDRQGVFHSWSAQGALDPVAIKSGSGCRLWDYDGREYLDFSSQMVNTNIGHQHPKVLEAIKTQLDELATLAPAHANYARGLAAEKILARAPERFKKVFFTNGGADAVENAIRLARKVTGREKVLSAYRSYHGGTGSAIAATGDFRRFPNEFARGHVHFFTPYLYRTDFWAQNEAEECTRALQHLRRVIESEGAGSIAAILLETVPGTAGILVPPEGYLAGVRALADEFGIMLILDEVMAGFGRTGQWLALDHFGVTPDLITFAKGVNSGYVPVGGVMISEHIAQHYDDTVFFGGLTYSGHPLAMASICATLDAMQEEDIVGNAERIGRNVLTPGLAQLAERHEIVGNVRGLGVFQAIELVEDRESREPLNANAMGQLKAALIERGLLPFIAANRIHVVPPCVITAHEAEQGLSIIDDVLTNVRST